MDPSACAAITPIVEFGQDFLQCVSDFTLIDDSELMALVDATATLFICDRQGNIKHKQTLDGYELHGIDYHAQSNSLIVSTLQKEQWQLRALQLSEDKASIAKQYTLDVPNPANIKCDYSRWIAADKQREKLRVYCAYGDNTQCCVQTCDFETNTVKTIFQQPGIIEDISYLTKPERVVFVVMWNESLDWHCRALFLDNDGVTLKQDVIVFKVSDNKLVKQMWKAKPSHGNQYLYLHCPKTGYIMRLDVNTPGIVAIIGVVRAGENVALQLDEERGQLWAVAGEETAVYMYNIKD